MDISSEKEQIPEPLDSQILRIIPKHYRSVKHLSLCLCVSCEMVFCLQAGHRIRKKGTVPTNIKVYISTCCLK